MSLQGCGVEPEGDGSTMPPATARPSAVTIAEADEAAVEDVDGDPAADRDQQTGAVSAASSGHCGWRVDWKADISVLGATKT